MAKTRRKTAVAFETRACLNQAANALDLGGSSGSCGGGVGSGFGLCGSGSSGLVSGSLKQSKRALM
jgi:hypothetical protein